MTNNPTIDGVSREFLERIRQYLIDIGEIGEFGAELFQLLNIDAPAVEPATALREHCKQCAEMTKDWPESKRNCLGSAPAVERQEPEVDDEKWWADTPDGDSALVTRVGALTEWQKGRDAMRDERDAALNEVAALQSTIAQLQARVAELKDGVDKHWKVVCDQRSRITELESGRCEPVVHLRAALKAGCFKDSPPELFDVAGDADI